MNEIETCVCGYKYRKDGFAYLGGVKTMSEDIGDEPFAIINMNATKECTIEGFYEVLKQVTVIMCPKCNTLKIGAG